jgi:hypothetical protein
MPDTCPTWCRSPYCPKLADDADRCHQTAPIGEHDEVFLDAEKLTHEYLKVDIGSLDALTPPSIQVYISADRGGQVEDAHLDLSAASARELAGWLTEAADQLDLLSSTY